MSSITKPFKKAVGSFMGGGGGESGSSSSTSSTVSPTTNVSTNIDFKDLAKALQTNAGLAAVTQKQIAAANQKTALIEVGEEQRQFNELMRIGKYTLSTAALFIAFYLYKKFKKKGKKT